MIAQESIQTIAAQAAGRNFAANLKAIKSRQPLLASELASDLPEDAPDVEWLLGRDGSLTARCDGHWWSGCSLPLRTGRKLLEKVELNAAVTCFLSPTHAAQLRVILDRLDAGRAMIAIIPEPFDLRLILACEPFEQDIAAGRLWFASGDQWETALERLLDQNDGLPLPGQFIRTALVEAEAIETMITAAQAVFSRQIPRRAETIQRLFNETGGNCVCVVVPELFRLWDDTGVPLGAIAAAQGWRTLNPDDPCHASPVAFCRAACDCETVIAPTLGRSDFPPSLPLSTRVITWITQPRIPRFIQGASGDRLLIADERWRPLALAGGWPAAQITVASWPTIDIQLTGSGLGIIADTLPLTPPTFELSSHKILWESIARQISDDPFSIGPDLSAYLNRWLTSTGIDAQTIDHDVFVHRLILPAWQQGLARSLIAARIAVKLFGRGWEAIDEFKNHSAGEVRSRDDLHRAIAACGALVHARPEPWNHPIDAFSRTVLRVGSKGKELWLAEARRLARGQGRFRATNAPELSADVIAACRAGGIAVTGRG